MQIWTNYSWNTGKEIGCLQNEPQLVRLLVSHIFFIITTRLQEITKASNNQPKITHLVWLLWRTHGAPGFVFFCFFILNQETCLKWNGPRTPTMSGTGHCHQTFSSRFKRFRITYCHMLKTSTAEQFYWSGSLTRSLFMSLQSAFRLYHPSMYPSIMED